MGIDTNLNIGPYFDDYDETKQYNKILFKPGYAVQARELTQLQTILQKQVERFGTNIYKEGTIISGVNITERPDIHYVKLNDQFDFTDPTIYEPSGSTKYYLVGQTSGLRAEILKSANGFQTQAPNLKTFFITYQNSNIVTDTQVQEFIAGEILKIEDQDGITVTTTNNNVTTDLQIRVSSLAGHVGKSYGVSVDEGILYQKGHFVYTEPQFIIISKYTNEPSNISVGFEVEETIVNARQDTSLYDNAQGSNNFNAPGADRLKLTPVLKSYFTTSEPDGFFALIKFQGGLPVLIRDVTQFNSIATEMARRTYEESGNYVVTGMDITLEQNQVGYGGVITNAVVAPGKAYAFGYEVNNIAPTKLSVDLVTDTKTKQNQITGADYGAYFEFDWAGTANNAILNSFLLDGTAYTLRDSGNTAIGTCRVKNIGSGQGTGLGKIYVYAIEKTPGQENTAIAKIGDTPVTGTLKKPNKGAMIYKVSNLNVKSLSNVNITRRKRLSVGNLANVTISTTATETPLLTNVVAVDASQNFIDVTSVTQNGTDVDIVLTANASIVYYDTVANDVSRDSLVQKTAYVKTTVSSGIANLGLPNVIRVLEVIDNNGAGVDVTRKFRLQNNQKEGFYDYSTLKLKPGETLSNSNLSVKLIALERNSVFGNTFLDATSYDGVQKQLLLPYTAKDGTVYDLLNCFDFRPYATPLVSYANTAVAADTVVPASPTFDTVIPIANGSNLYYDFTYYLSRIDTVGINADGIIGIYPGTASEIPSPPRPSDVFALAEVFVPGNIINLRSIKSPAVKKVATKTYTMKDIEGIDKRVARLTEAVALTMLELEADNLFIPDQNGLNRFKNGILADNFRNLNIADFKDPEYSAHINRMRRYAGPRLDEAQVDLKVLSGSGVDLGFNEVVTLAHSGTLVNFITQPFATNTRRPSSGSINYRGKANIYPQYDATHDIATAPDVDLSVLGAFAETTAGTDGSASGVVNYGADGSTPSNANTVPDLNATLETASRTSGFLENLKKILLSRYEKPTVTTSEDITSTSTSKSEIDLNSGGIADIVVPIKAGSYLSGFNLNFGTTEGETRTLGPYITDLSIKPYISGKQVKVYVTGLRPNTRHHFYFNSAYVNQHVYPGVVNATTATTNGIPIVETCAINGTKGAKVYSDNAGNLAAIFEIPEGTFPVGEHTLVISDAISFEDIGATSTSYAQAKYRAYNFNTETQSVNITTRTLEVESETNYTQKSVTTNYTPRERDKEDPERGFDVDGDGNSDFDSYSEARDHVESVGGDTSAGGDIRSVNKS